MGLTPSWVPHGDLLDDRCPVLARGGVYVAHGIVPGGAIGWLSRSGVTILV